MALKILIADDNITAQNLGKKILAEAGYEVVAVSNGAAAMKKIASEKPDILILDVYMPGYSGLEVCQKVRGAADTARLPVLLAVGQMEAFSAEEGNKAKADGVITKPFVASDLLAALQKFSEKVRASAAEPKAEYTATVKMAAASEAGIQDASYEAWKAEAPEAEVIEAEPERVRVPQEMAASPALGLDEMLGPGFGARDLQRMPGEAPSAPGLEFEPESAASAPIAAIPVVPAHGVEFTPAPKEGEARFETAPELMVEEHPTAEIPITTDAALITDRTQMATEFATKFGVEHPEEITVGIAGQEISAITAIPEVPPEAGAALETAEMQAASASLQAEMKRAWEAPPEPPVAEAAVAPPEPAPESFLAAPPAPPSLPAAEGGDVTSRLVAQFAAELDRVAASAPAEEPEVAPPPPPVEAAAPEPAPEPTDEERVAQAISRVLERVKPDLIAEIVRELKRS